MPNNTRRAATLVAALALTACSAHDLVAPTGNPVARLDVTTASLPSVYFSEIHYDNVGTDIGEAIEIDGPAGMDVTGWSVVLYNGNGGASYNTQTLSGTIPATCSARGVIVLTYPTNGIQNGGTGGRPRRTLTAWRSSTRPAPSSSSSRTKVRSPPPTVPRSA